MRPSIEPKVKWSAEYIRIALDNAEFARDPAEREEWLTIVGKMRQGIWVSFPDRRTPEEVEADRVEAEARHIRYLEEAWRIPAAVRGRYKREDFPLGASSRDRLIAFAGRVRRDMAEAGLTAADRPAR
ncbi:hypothetical protein JYK14_24485 [Siccirubricoccus sp. KC 17139]|uniref:Uncharacterized protein n=1 Tax=Siccirubricoccus soli TaxID=2899147 RepID=A0ABT1DBG7_9PROT|nr:hypothetical protein [Siccirubricoccus soli]MCO6419293.1 hypothetical protein [Siccirubricoccus soli]MCP2685428.1 hypothetical protein [Siccirubricoccus soli]